MADNRGVLYLPGSRGDGLALDQAQRELNRVRSRQSDGGAGDQAGGQGRNRLPRAVGEARHRDGQEGRQGGSRVVAVLVQMQIVQLLVVLGAVLVAWIVHGLGWF